MSHVVRKPVFAICEQQRRRLACASAQSDQHLCFRCLDSIIPLVSISENASLHLVSVTVQTSLSPWSQTPKTGFLVMRLICKRKTYHSSEDGAPDPTCEPVNENTGIPLTPLESQGHHLHCSINRKQKLTLA